MDPAELKQALDAGGILFTEHARVQMAKRELSEDDVAAVLSNPGEVVELRPGRIVAQAVVHEYLLRVFIDVDRQPFEVVTAYRTSRIERYRRNP